MSSIQQSGSLTLVGSGIKCVSHLTMEAITYIQQSDHVLYLVNIPAMQEWIQQNNLHAESLERIYQAYALRRESYEAIARYIVESLQKHRHLCVVLYGHPTVFAQPGLEAVKQAIALGYDARILPGISAEDCLFADLLINPGSSGCQSFETTDFLLHQRFYDHLS